MAQTSSNINSFFESIDLETVFPPGPIVFTHAEISTKYKSPLALIRYKIEGDMQNNGLRLDLDKKVFLDLPCINPDYRQIAVERAEDISIFISNKLKRKRFLEMDSCFFEPVSL